MVLRFLVAAALLAATFALPIAAASPPSCASVTMLPQLATIGVYPVAGAKRVEVWTESNMLPGLQRVACEDANGRTWLADDLAAEFDVPCVPTTTSCY